MGKVVALPGCTPSTFVNEDAIQQLEGVIEQLRSGVVVGVAYTTIHPTGKCRTGWNCPSHMGNHLYAGLGRLMFQMVASSEDE